MQLCVFFRISYICVCSMFWIYISGNIKPNYVVWKWQNKERRLLHLKTNIYCMLQIVQQDAKIQFRFDVLM
jgi:hypothetical protein